MLTVICSLSNWKTRFIWKTGCKVIRLFGYSFAEIIFICSLNNWKTRFIRKTGYEFNRLFDYSFAEIISVYNYKILLTVLCNLNNWKTRFIRKTGYKVIRLFGYFYKFFYFFYYSRVTFVALKIFLCIYLRILVNSVANILNLKQFKVNYSQINGFNG